MRSLSVSELLAVWERGWGPRPFERALALLSAASLESSPAALARVPLGRRDVLLMQLREWTFGPDLPLLVPCPQCGQTLEMALPVASLQTSPIRNDDALEQIAFVAGGFEVCCRPPNTEDLVACVDLEASVRRARLLERCVIDVRRADEAV